MEHFQLHFITFEVLMSTSQVWNLLTSRFLLWSDIPVQAVKVYSKLNVGLAFDQVYSRSAFLLI